MIIDSVLKQLNPDIFFQLKGFIKTSDVFLKLEGLNLAGNIKMKAAHNMLDHGIKHHNIKPGKNKIIESSSGNLAISLAMETKELGFDFYCVADPNLSSYCRQYIELFNGKIITVMEKDLNGGYLNTRINKIIQIINEDPSFYWPNQYMNKANPEAHEKLTAQEIFSQFPNADYIFTAISTTGTIGGIAKFYKEKSPKTKIIAVDAIGSILFGNPAGKRFIPGLGASRIPEIFSEDNIYDLIRVNELDMISMCRKILHDYTLFVGGSSGAVLKAIDIYQQNFKKNDVIIGISPDFGHKYIDTIYNDKWVTENYNWRIST
jgi:cysteine synthase A